MSAPEEELRILPFAGEVVAFTGKLATLDRKQAHALVEQLGGHVVDEVTTKTTMLVRGAGRLREPTGGNEPADAKESEKTAKLRKAEELSRRGDTPIRILDESAFCTLAGLTPPDALRAQYYALRDIIGMYPRLREDHARYLEKWGVLGPSVRTRSEAYFEFSDLAVFRQVSAGLEEGLPFRTVLKSLQAAHSGQLEFDFRIDAPTAKIVQLGERRKATSGTSGALEVSESSAAIAKRAEECFRQGAALDTDRATYAEAAAWYRRALEADPYLVAALINLANIHYASDELVEAQALYERAIGLEPTFFEAHFNLGNICHDLGRYDEAATCYREALLLNPRHPDTHFYLAVTLEKLGRSTEAKPHWRSYQDLAPDGEWVELAREFSE